MNSKTPFPEPLRMKQSGAHSANVKHVPYLFYEKWKFLPSTLWCECDSTFFMCFWHLDILAPRKFLHYVVATTRPSRHTYNLNSCPNEILLYVALWVILQQKYTERAVCLLYHKTTSVCVRIDRVVNWRLYLNWTSRACCMFVIPSQTSHGMPRCIPGLILTCRSTIRNICSSKL